MKPRALVAAVAKEFGMTATAIGGIKKHAPFIRARAICVHLLRKHFRLSYKEIGAELGGRDHATILASLRAAERYLEDRTTADRVTLLERRLGLNGIEEEALLKDTTKIKWLVPGDAYPTRFPDGSCGHGVAYLSGILIYVGDVDGEAVFVSEHTIELAKKARGWEEKS